MEKTVGVRRFETGGRTANHNAHVRDVGRSKLIKGPLDEQKFRRCHG
jgi:hypothetical protein